MRYSPPACPGLVVLPLLALLLPGCSESPFAPEPIRHSCGSADHPCPYACSMDCAEQVVLSAAACASTLEGTLSFDRTACRFADDSRVTFQLPLPASSLKLRSGPLDFRIERGGEICLAVQRLAGQPVGEGKLHQSIRVQGSLGDYRQEVWELTADAGPTAPEVARVLCGGRFFEGPAGDCLRCGEGGCRLRGLLELRIRPELPLEVGLGSGELYTPLFTCR